MGFSGDISPGFVFIDIFIDICGEGQVILGAAGRRVSWSCVAAFSAVVLGTVSLKVSRSFAGETSHVSHIARVDERRGTVGFFCEINFGAEWVGLLFWSRSGRGRWSALQRRGSVNGGGSSTKGWLLNDPGQLVSVFLYSCSLKGGKEGDFLFSCVQKDMLVLCPGFIDDGELRVLGDAGLDGKSVRRVGEEAIGGDQRGGEINILHFVWGVVRCVTSFYNQRGFLWHVLSFLLVPKNSPKLDILATSRDRETLSLSFCVQ